MNDVRRLLLTNVWVDGAVRSEVAVDVEGGRFTHVGPVDPADHPRERVAGLALPGFANAHSHVFHRALRGRTQAGAGTFWTWREQMYAVADRLDPDLLFSLARAAYAEMLCAGVTTVGEFHYLHHDRDGRRYADPNETGRVLIAAAREVGLRIALLDTCYLAAGIGRAPEGVQRRFSDGDAEQWAARVSDLAEDDTTRIGAAIHSVRAVPRDQVPVVVAASEGRPLHVHLSEQVAENEECQAVHGISPTGLLHDAGALGPLTSAVHATHLSDADVRILGGTGTSACFCPTTERDLADGVGPSRLLHAAGSPLTLGSDSHAVIDHFEEMRAVELNERLVSQRRGTWPASDLLDAATVNGHRSLGFADAGRVAVGCRADLVVVDPQSPRTAGTGVSAESAVFAAGAGDVVAVMADGRWHDVAALRPTVGSQLHKAIDAVWEAST